MALCADSFRCRLGLKSVMVDVSGQMLCVGTNAREVVAVTTVNERHCQLTGTRENFVRNVM